MHGYFLPQYESAKIYNPKSGTWLIEWYNFHPKHKKLQRVRKTFNINRIRSTKERKRVASNLVSYLNQALANGWNYFVHELGITSDETSVYNPSLIEALDSALEERKIGRKQRTVESYNSFYNVFSEWLNANSYDKLPVKLFTHNIFSKFLHDRANQGYSNRNINDYINFYKTTFDIIVDKEIIDKNPIEKIKYLPKIESSKFELITDNELMQIGTKLKAHNINFYLATLFVGHLFIRPGHLNEIKRKHISFDAETLTMPGAISKNRKNKVKQIFPEIIALMQKLKLHELDNESYIFGKDFEPASLKHNRLSKDASDLWKRLIINELGIQKHLYALKHTGATYYINENDHIDSSWLQNQMEHRDLHETETYISKRKVKQINTKETKRIKY